MSVTNRYVKRSIIIEAKFVDLVEIEIGESSLGAKGVKGKRGRGAYGKTPVFGIFQRGGSVYTEIVPDYAWKTLLAIIRARIDPDSVIHSNSWRGYTGLVDLNYKKYFRVRRGKNELANCRRHINGIESFWSYAERLLTPFHGVPRSTFYFQLKECEFRVNHRGENIYRGLFKLLRKNPLI